MSRFPTICPVAVALIRRAPSLTLFQFRGWDDAIVSAVEDLNNLTLRR